MAALMQRLSLSATSSRASTFHGASMSVPVAPVNKAVQVPFQVEAAHKKGTGSSKNGRDSNAQRLGVKVYGDQPVKAGGIIVRQRGMTFKADEGCFMGKDFTIHAKIDGVVKFKKNKTVHKIQVFPDEPVEYDRSADTRRNRRLAQYPPRATLREAESS